MLFHGIYNNCQYRELNEWLLPEVSVFFRHMLTIRQTAAQKPYANYLSLSILYVGITSITMRPQVGEHMWDPSLSISLSLSLSLSISLSISLSLYIYIYIYIYIVPGGGRVHVGPLPLRDLRLGEVLAGHLSEGGMIRFATLIVLFLFNSRFSSLSSYLLLSHFTNP